MMVENIFRAMIAFGVMLQCQLSLAQGLNQKDLIGKWTFCECWKSQDKKQYDCVEYNMSIDFSGSQFLVDIDKDGHHAATHVHAEGVIDDDSFKITYVSENEGHGWPEFRKGDLLLLLTRKNGEIITQWRGIRPTLDENKKDGKYFVLTKNVLSIKKENNHGIRSHGHVDSRRSAKSTSGRQK